MSPQISHLKTYFFAVAAFAACPSFAQNAQEDPAKPAARQNRFIEEVVVTAQKREESLSDVPISVSAFSSEKLDALGIVDPKDLTAVTPGLQYGTTSGYSIVYLRGIGTDAFIPSADSSVATYVDGVYMPFTSAGAQAFGTIERIEVLKGPQGTLFGRNSTGGAINVVTKQPSPDLEASAQLTVGNYDTVRRRGYLNLPLTETLAVNLGVLRNTSESYYEHVNSNVKIPDSETEGYRGKIRWLITDNLEWSVGAYKVDQDLTDSSLQVQLAPKLPVPGLGVQPDYKTDANEIGYLKGEFNVLTTDALWTTEAFDIKFIGSKQDMETDTLVDFDSSAAPLIVFQANKTFAEIKTAELQFISNENSWGSDWLTWIGGLYYLESEAGYDPVTFSVGPSLPFPLNILNPYAATVYIEGVLETESTAAFTQLTANLTDSISLTLGGRYQTEDRGLIRANSNVFLEATGQVQLLEFENTSTKTSNFSPKVVLDYKFGDNNMVYLSWTKGFKSGTYNIVNVTDQPEFVEPEEVTTIEAGIKAEFLDRNLRLNAAVFDNEIIDVQAQVVSLTSGGAATIENAGTAVIRGAEFDMQWVPAPQSLPGLVLTSSAAWLDSEYQDYFNASGYDQGTGLFFGPRSILMPQGRDFSGHEVIRTPEWTANVGMAYVFQLTDSEIEVAADAYYNSGYYYTAQNTKAAEEDPYSLVNARLSYLYLPWNVRLTAFGKNLTDEAHYLFKYETDVGASGTLDAPRTYGLRVNWEY